jgi:hypothetical protein
MDFRDFFVFPVSFYQVLALGSGIKLWNICKSLFKKKEYSLYLERDIMLQLLDYDTIEVSKEMSADAFKPVNRNSVYHRFNLTYHFFKKKQPVRKKHYETIINATFVAFLYLECGQIQLPDYLGINRVLFR